MMSRIRIGVFTFMLAVVMSSAADAQTGNRFALGIHYSIKAAEAAAVRGHQSVGLTWRFGHSKTGWGWSYGLNWFSADIDQLVGGQTTELGHLRVRPFMGGYGYTRVFGRTSINADLLGGYAITSFKLTPAASDAYRDRLGARSIDARVGNTFVLKPDVSLWYDVSRKVGVNVGAGYMIARPSVTVSSSLGDEVRRLRADTFMLKVGVVYSILSKK